MSDKDQGAKKEINHSEGSAVAEHSELTEDTKPEQDIKEHASGNKLFKLVNGFKNKSLKNKKRAGVLVALILLILFSVVPQTKYLLPGIFIKKDIAVLVENSRFDSFVSDAKVEIDGVSATTSGRGTAKLKGIHVGKHTIKITKKYYKTIEVRAVVGFSSNQVISLDMEPEGILVKVHVKNKINGNKLEGAKIVVGDTSAKTDSEGEAVLVLPFSSTRAEAKTSLDKYVEKSSNLEISRSEIKLNNIDLTPLGKIYFLSKESGKIDVVKTNLDGTDRKVVLAGTGKEDDGDTVMLASTDWSYLALKSKRDGGDDSKLFLIDTKNDNVSNIDEGKANFSVYGWSGKYLIYQVDRHISGQKEKYRLKSFDATTKKITVLDRTEALYNENNYGYTYDPYDFYRQVILADGKVYYAKLWQTNYYAYGLLDGKKHQALSINPDGTDKKVLISTEASKINAYDMNGFLYKPDEIYLFGYDVTKGKNRYFEWELGSKKVKELTNNAEEVAKFNQPYPTYLVSPSGKENLWSESRDGKSVIFIGDEKAEKAKQVARLSEYLQYGWFTDDYLLLSKAGSELYIMPKSGIGEGKDPIKISDYHKPYYSYNGYGGGYGGY